MVAAGMPSLDYTLTNAKSDYTTSAKGLRTKTILDLVAWLVAHPSKDLIVQDQAQLKEKILAEKEISEPLTGQLERRHVVSDDGPQSQAAVGAGRRDESVIGRERESFDRPRMTGHRLDERLRFHVPQSDRSIITGRRNTLAVRRDRDALAALLQ